MSARKSAKVREYVQKPYDVGDVLLWIDYNDTERMGTVWCDGPKVGTRWVVEDDGSVALLKPYMSGRRAGRVDQIARHKPGWQRRVIRALDLLHRSTVWTSTHTEQVPWKYDPKGYYESQRITVHVDRDCCAELDEGQWGPSGQGGAEYVRNLLRSGTDWRGNEIDAHRKITDTMDRLCPKCIGDLAESVAA